MFLLFFLSFVRSFYLTSVRKDAHGKAYDNHVASFQFGNDDSDYEQISSSFRIPAKGW